MVRHKQFKSGGKGKNGAGNYYCEHLSQSAYYANGMGILQGKTFEHLKMENREISLEVFTALENNLHPLTGEKLTPRTNGTRLERMIDKETGKEILKEVENRRPGLDLLIVAPKTVGEVCAENPGKVSDKIMAAFVRSKDKAMQFAETLARTQANQGNQRGCHHSGNLLYLSVLHMDSRPVGSSGPDPVPWQNSGGFLSSP